MHQDLSVDQLFQRVVESMGLEYVGSEGATADAVAGLVRVYIDSQAGIDVETCAKVSRQLDATLRVEGFDADSYRLEVSSPGIERPLFNVQHYQRFVGEKVAIAMRAPVEGQRRFKGTLLEATENTVTLSGDDDSRWELPFVDIERGHLVVDVVITKAKS